jgi:biopolymer transport protein ExbD
MHWEGENSMFNKMIKRERKRFAPEIQLIPLIDILFVLLAFFMLNTTFSETNASINIKLPESTVEQVAVNKVIVISVDDKKQIYLNSTKLTIETLEEELKNELLIQNRGDVIINADKLVEYGFVVKIMTIAKNAGAVELDIATEKQEE